MGVLMTAKQCGSVCSPQALIYMTLVSSTTHSGQTDMARKRNPCSTNTARMIRECNYRTEELYTRSRLEHVPAGAIFHRHAY